MKKSIITLISITLLLSCNSSRTIISKHIRKDFVKIGDVYWSKYEVTNQEYRLFLAELKTENNNDYERSQIDSTKWYEEGNLANPMARNYHYHPAFDDSPVVNISIYGAKKYCEWLTQKAKKAGINKTFRLPTKEEFEDLLETVTIKFDSDKSVEYGKIHMNMKFEEGRAPDGGEFAVRTKGFYGQEGRCWIQNKYGMYHIIGNVSEYLDDNRSLGGNWNSFPSESTKVIETRGPNARTGFRVIFEDK